MKPRKPRGRPRAFDPTVALEAMTAEFWKKGFSATSLDDLSRAAGLNRPSIYAAFGDKLSIFLDAIDAFAESLSEDLDRRLDPSASLEDVLNAFFAVGLDAYFRGAEPRGCFVFSTAIAEASAHPAIAERVSGLLTELEDQLVQRIASEHAAGWLEASEREAIARLAIGQLQLISTSARAGRNKATLTADAKRASHLLAQLAE